MSTLVERSGSEAEKEATDERVKESEGENEKKRGEGQERASGRGYTDMDMVHSIHLSEVCALPGQTIGRGEDAPSSSLPFLLLFCSCFCVSVLCASACLPACLSHSGHPWSTSTSTTSAEDNGENKSKNKQDLRLMSLALQPLFLKKKKNKRPLFQRGAFSSQSLFVFALTEQALLHTNICTHTRITCSLSLSALCLLSSLCTLIGRSYTQSPSDEKKIQKIDGLETCSIHGCGATETWNCHIRPARTARSQGPAAGSVVVNATSVDFRGP